MTYKKCIIIFKNVHFGIFRTLKRMFNSEKQQWRFLKNVKGDALTSSITTNYSLMLFYIVSKLHHLLPDIHGQ